MPYELIEHTADTGFTATGETLDEAFAAAVDGFAAIVHQDADVEPDGTDTVSVTAENLEALVFDFVGKLIYLQDAEARLVCGAEHVAVSPPGGMDPAEALASDADGDWTVEATIGTATLERGMGLLDIKGPTYNEMRVEETEDGWLLRTVLDI